MDNTDYDVVNPDVAVIIGSLRSMGYSLEMAVADVIDNSISANASDIYFETDSEGNFMMISDNGEGMSETEVVEAMKFGSKDVKDERKTGDLGRFGLGLKTASISLCKKITLASKKRGGEISIRQWDLDYIQKYSKNSSDWRLKKVSISDYSKISESLARFEQGTVVYWEDFDRGLQKSSSEITKDYKEWYGNQIIKIIRHLEMVFHWYISDEDFILHIPPNNQPALAWDPYMKTISDPLPEELQIQGIVVYPYVLPHRSKITEGEYEMSAGPLKSWSRAQGFYVYREKRLITAGSWLDLEPGFVKGKDTDLARIKLVYNSKNDVEWTLDVKKNAVKVPRRYRKDLKRIARNTRDRARSVKLHKGKIPRREHPGDYTFLWATTKNRDGKVRYKINRHHPLIDKLKTEPESFGKEEINALLRMIEECVPTQGIIMQEYADPDSPPEAFEDTGSDELNQLLMAGLKIWRNTEMSLDEKKSMLCNMEPFSEYPEFIDNFLRGEL